MKTAGADPNDPALHNMPEEGSHRSHSRVASPKGVSPRGSGVTQTRPHSFTSSQGAMSTVSSPVSRPAAENDSFTRSISSSKNKDDHEGVELGDMRGSSHNIGDELLAEQLQSWQPGADQPSGARQLPEAGHTSGAGQPLRAAQTSGAGQSSRAGQPAGAVQTSGAY